ncbi:hypothetical protein LTR84_003249 [Exophiala bonariae]|uniref:ABM domain-containing protein n=1 Tax=Exophiala bonariae TaxID=1690606 RepID=A0AAV9NC86_9EURO|nr:hypothetical protein LTR84_003249 [Exophiala bonariae]
MYYAILKARKLKEKPNETGFASPHINHLGVLISIWEDVDAISRWRNQATHLRIQQKANQDVYDDYRVRVGPELDNATSRETSLDDTSPVVLLYYRESLETTPKDDTTSLLESTVANGIQSHLLSSSVYLGPRTLWISSWQSEKVARQFTSLLSRIQNDDLKIVRTQRDYTKSRRNDTPSEKAGSL